MPDSVLASLADARVLYLTTIGRRSGQPRTIEIWFTCCQSKLYLNAERAHNANWVRNIVQHPEVQVRIKEQQFAGRARVLDHQADRVLWDTVADLSRQKYGWGRGAVKLAPLRRRRRGERACRWRLRYTKVQRCTLTPHRLRRICVVEAYRSLLL